MKHKCYICLDDFDDLFLTKLGRRVCDDCYKKDMLSAKDVINVYGVPKYRLSTIRYYSSKSRCTSPEYYLKDDIVNLCNRLLKSACGQEKNQLLITRQKLNDYEINKELLEQHKINIKKILYTLLLKHEYKYISYYMNFIDDEINKITDLTLSCNIVAFSLCHIIEKDICRNRDKYDKQIEISKRTTEIKKIINECGYTLDAIRTITICSNYVNCIGAYTLNDCRNAIIERMEGDKQTTDRKNQLDRVIKNIFIPKYLNYVQNTPEYKNFVYKGSIDQLHIVVNMIFETHKQYKYMINKEYKVYIQ